MAVIASRLPIADVPPVANGFCTVTVLRKKEFKGSALTHYVSLDATAYVKGSLLQVTFEASDARAKKDQVIALLKAAAQRL